jgi:hypothetical protein
MSYEQGILWEKGWRVEAGRGLSGSFALERRAQDDGKNKQRQEQTTARTNNGKNRQRQEQTTARTDNGKNRQRQEQTTARTKCGGPSTAFGAKNAPNFAQDDGVIGWARDGRARARAKANTEILAAPE